MYDKMISMDDALDMFEINYRVKQDIASASRKAGFVIGFSAASVLWVGIFCAWLVWQTFGPVVTR